MFKKTVCRVLASNKQLVNCFANPWLPLDKKRACSSALDTFHSITVERAASFSCGFSHHTQKVKDKMRNLSCMVKVENTCSGSITQFYYALSNVLRQAFFQHLFHTMPPPLHTHVMRSHVCHVCDNGKVFRGNCYSCPGVYFTH